MIRSESAKPSTKMLRQLGLKIKSPHQNNGPINHWMSTVRMKTMTGCLLCLVPWSGVRYFNKVTKWLPPWTSLIPYVQKQQHTTNTHVTFPYCFGWRYMESLWTFLCVTVKKKVHLIGKNYLPDYLISSEQLCCRERLGLDNDLPQPSKLYWVW